MIGSRRPACVASVVALVLIAAAPASVRAQSFNPVPALKFGLYGIRMEPSRGDADDFSRPGWGGGLQVVAPLPQVHNLFAGVLGFEFVNLLSETVEFYEQPSLLRIEQQTTQDYMRLYLGPRVGPHGYGFIRPHLGTNVALVFYGISTDVVVPDDYDYEQEIRQSLSQKHHAAFGWDATGGVDFNFFSRITADVGVRYLRTFNVPQQLGAGAVTIHPEYLQIYVGFGLIPAGFPEGED
jgi:hypothetical protein